MLNYITWSFDPYIIDSFISVRWYGLLFAVGFLIGYHIVNRIFKHEGAKESWVSSLLIWVGVGTIIGARLGHVFFYKWDYYSQNLIEIFKTWEGGLASHGGAIGVAIAVLLYSKFVTKRNALWTFDRLVIPVALVGALIRLGNLFNSEIFGHPTTLPWGFMFVDSPEWQRNFYGLACHPTQLYEALSYLILFGLLMWMYWRKNAQERQGLIFGTFLTILFSARFLIEFVKNSQVDFENSMTLNMGQLLSIPFIVVGIILIIYSLKHPRIKIDYPNKFADEDKIKDIKKN